MTPQYTSCSSHIPVMLDEVLAALSPRDGGAYVDGTFGTGGYTRALLDVADTTVWAIDRDPDAIRRGDALREEFGERLTLLQGRFGEMTRLLRAAGLERVDGVVLDLGVSSPQLCDAERGFSFRFDGPLDMRMEKAGPSAADLVNTLDELELARLIRELGDEKRARRVARFIVEARAAGPITRTSELAKIVRRAVPQSRSRIDPATRTFMALRLQVNDELGQLDAALRAAEEMLAPRGHLVVVSFHSLEDRRVKNLCRIVVERALIARAICRRLWRIMHRVSVFFAAAPSNRGTLKLNTIRAPAPPVCAPRSERRPPPGLLTGGAWHDEGGFRRGLGCTRHQCPRRHVQHYL